MRSIACSGLVAAVTILGASATARAEQVVVFDQTWVHTPDLADSHFRMGPDAATPADWTSPTDYSGGSAWVYLEVHTKPTAQETKFQVCFEANPTYACTYQSPTYTDVGTYEWETPFTGFWSPPGEYVDWTQGVNNIACILKDTMNGKPSADNVGDEVAALYTPTEVRLVVTLVEAGGVYEPPTPTGATTGSDSGEGSSDGGGSSESTTTDADTSSGGASSSSEGGGSSSGGASTATTTTATSDGSVGTSESGATPADDAGESGCGCASAPPSRGAWLGLLAVLLVRRRRPAR